MIHQLIFASPKPGMSEQDFLDYWKNVHAIKYASKIPQIRRYMIDSRIPLGEEQEDPLFSGVAEIWMKEKDKIASLQSEEFVKGAKRDEPNWAAYWRTIVLDTNAHVLLEGEPLRKDSNRVKLLIMVKRKGGLPLAEFRQEMLDSHSAKVLKIPGLRRYLQCHVIDGFYTVGESVLDCVSQLWFDDVESLEQACNSPEYKDGVQGDYEKLFESKYIHTMVTDETWIIGPESR